MANAKVKADAANVLFNEDDLIEFAQRELGKNGLSDTEDVIDPETGRKIKGVLTGSRFFMKLHHTSESKAQGRAMGSYTAEGTPAKGGSEGASASVLNMASMASSVKGFPLRFAYGATKAFVSALAAASSAGCDTTFSGSK